MRRHDKPWVTIEDPILAAGKQDDADRHAITDEVLAAPVCLQRVYSFRDFTEIWPGEDGYDVSQPTTGGT